MRACVPIELDSISIEHTPALHSFQTMSVPWLWQVNNVVSLSQCKENILPFVVCSSKTVTKLTPENTNKTAAYVLVVMI